MPCENLSGDACNLARGFKGDVFKKTYRLPALCMHSSLIAVLLFSKLDDKAGQGSLQAYRTSGLSRAAACSRRLRICSSQ